MRKSCQSVGCTWESHMSLKISKISDRNSESASAACNIRIVIPEGPEDLSGKSFLICVVNSSRVKGSIRGDGCVVWQWTPVLVRKRV